MRALLIEGMRGLGDNIYQRPFVRAAAERRAVFLDTPWPEIYRDLPVRFVRPETRLRTQRLNAERQAAEIWSRRPPGAESVRFSYAGAALRVGSILQAMDRTLPLGGAPLQFDLPEFGPSPVVADKPIAVVRPVTVRSEWRNEARNPLPEYVAAIAEDLRRTHHVVALAHLAEGQEWALTLPPHDQGFLRGDLDVSAMLALVAAADVVVGGVGWIVPAAIALRRKAFVILGGQGGHNAPAKITDPRMDLSRIGWATPDPYCLCERMDHQCSKSIPDLMRTWRAWRAAQGV